MQRQTSLSTNAIRALGVLALGSVGALLAASLATADGLPGTTTAITISTPSTTLPSTTLPSTGTATLPSLPGTGTTTTAADPTTTSSASTSPAPASTPGSTTPAGNPSGAPGTRDAAATPTAIRLPSGGLSVAASNLRPPTRLLIDRVQLSPATIRAPKQLVTLTLRVRDDAGHVIRGASVTVTGNPTAAARTTRSSTSILGTAMVRVLSTPIAHHSRLLLLLRVSAGQRGMIQTARLLAVPVRL
jgi:hypothetical protein